MVCKKVRRHLRARLISLTTGQNEGQMGIKQISSKKGNKQRVELGPVEVLREAAGCSNGRDTKQAAARYLWGGLEEGKGDVITAGTQWHGQK